MADLASYHRHHQVEIANHALIELIRACERFGPMASPHEGWAVIREELDELWEHVKANTGATEGALIEAIQVAAMALRYALDLCSEVFPAEIAICREDGGGGNRTRVRSRTG